MFVQCAVRVLVYLEDVGWCHITVGRMRHLDGSIGSEFATAVWWSILVVCSERSKAESLSYLRGTIVLDGVDVSFSDSLTSVILYVA